MTSQYRCETCKKYQSHGCNHIGEFLTESEKEFTAKIGCASHSDFQSEREKVLEEERKKWIQKFDSALNMAGKDRDYQLHNVLEILKELRQGDLG